MDTIAAIKARRAIKHFDPNHELTEEELSQLVELMMLSPTAFNIQNWRIVLVKDKAQRAKIREAAWDQAQVTDASALFVLTADLKAWQKEPERYWRNAPQEVADMLVPATTQYYQGNEQVQRDEAMRSCGIAAQTIMLTAKAMGYDSCPMDGFDFDKVGQIINLPENHIISMFVVVGKKIKDAWPRPGQLAKEEILVVDSF